MHPIQKSTRTLGSQRVQEFPALSTVLHPAGSRKSPAQAFNPRVRTIHASFCRKLANFSKTILYAKKSCRPFQGQWSLFDVNGQQFIWNHVEFFLTFSDMLVNYLFILNSISLFPLFCHSLFHVGRRCDRLRSFPLWNLSLPLEIFLIIVFVESPRRQTLFPFRISSFRR